MRLILVVIVLAATLVYALLNFRSYFEVREIEVPDLLGVAQERATEQLRSLGLEPVVFNETIVTAEVGAVTSQTPRPGTLVREGRRISLGVNVPSASVQVPILAGRQLSDVRNELGELNLLIGEISYDFSSQAQGTVLGQNPEPGAVVTSGTTINLTVSRGSNIPTAALPDVIGDNIEEAQRELRALGFTNIRTIAGGVSFDRPGSVLDQLPLPGETVPLSTNITLAYALSTDTVVPVPALQGRTLREAQNLLRAQGLTVGALSYIDDPEQPSGVVSYQPVGYTLSGSPISIVINGDERLEAEPPSELFDDVTRPTTTRPPSTASPIRPITGTPSSQADTSATTEADAVPEGGRTIPFNFDPVSQGLRSLESQPYKLTLVVSDDRGERTVIDRNLAAGEGVRETVTVFGDALLQTYINDLLFQAWNP
jgi:beta-lactam-binding protein with PASTA domain